MTIQTTFDLNTLQALLIDMDGVLWLGKELLPGLVPFFGLLQTRHLPFMLVTNNASNTPAHYVKKFAGFGVTITPENLLTSSLATAAYLKQIYKPGSRVFVVGQEGLRQAMQQAGFVLLDNADQPADIVVAGIDFTITYDKLKYATFLIQRGARFIGTNGDLTFPSEEGIAPGGGAILAAIEAATGVTPTLIGKPERYMFDIAVQKLGIAPEQTAMLGDRLETDILGGQRAGLKTILVTTGIDNEDTIPKKGIQPDAIFSGIAALTEYWAALP